MHVPSDFLDALVIDDVDVLGCDTVGTFTGYLRRNG
jgi:hypothetical protein